MWAVCQAAIMRSAHAEKEADDVLPLLEILVENGARVEQR